jgi:nicotinamide-nucleotide amidase
MWPAALETGPVRAALAGRAELRQSTIRLWGTRESELAATLREQGDRLDGLEITTCLREGEVEIVTRYGVSAQPAYDRLHAVLAQTYAATAFSLDGATIDEVVARALLNQALTVATAESCTAGLLAGRLTDLAGSSAYVMGGLVVYSNQAKHDLAGVPMELIVRVGAVSPEVAEALAEGARARLGADIGVGITGIAGPGGGSADKPVGLVYLGVSGLGTTIVRKLNLPGSRADVRRRTVVIALHQLRELLVPLEAQ